MLIERGDSWFSPKCIEVQPHATTILEVERWMGSGPSAGYQPQPNCECQDRLRVSETMGAKLHRQKGNSPDHELRSLNRCSVLKAVRAQRQLGCWIRSRHHCTRALRYERRGDAVGNMNPSNGQDGLPDRSARARKNRRARA